MELSLTPDNPATSFSVHEPGRGPGDEALASGEIMRPMVPALNRSSADLPSSGVHNVAVYL